MHEALFRFDFTSSMCDHFRWDESRQVAFHHLLRMCRTGNVDVKLNETVLEHEHQKFLKIDEKWSSRTHDSLFRSL